MGYKQSPPTLGRAASLEALLTVTFILLAAVFKIDAFGGLFVAQLSIALATFVSFIGTKDFGNKSIIASVEVYPHRVQLAAISAAALTSFLAYWDGKDRYLLSVFRFEETLPAHVRAVFFSVFFMLIILAIAFGIYAERSTNDRYFHQKYRRPFLFSFWIFLLVCVVDLFAAYFIWAGANVNPPKIIIPENILGAPIASMTYRENWAIVYVILLVAHALISAALGSSFRYAKAHHWLDSRSKPSAKGPDESAERIRSDDNPFPPELGRPSVFSSFGLWVFKLDTFVVFALVGLIVFLCIALTGDMNLPTGGWRVSLSHVFFSAATSLFVAGAYFVFFRWLPARTLRIIAVLAISALISVFVVFVGQFLGRLACGAVPSLTICSKFTHGLLAYPICVVCLICLSTLLTVGLAMFVQQPCGDRKFPHAWILFFVIAAAFLLSALLGAATARTVGCFGDSVWDNERRTCVCPTYKLSDGSLTEGVYDPTTRTCNRCSDFVVQIPEDPPKPPRLTGKVAKWPSSRYWVCRRPDTFTASIEKARCPSPDPEPCDYCGADASPIFAVTGSTFVNAIERLDCRANRTIVVIGTPSDSATGETASNLAQSRARVMAAAVKDRCAEFGREPNILALAFSPSSPVEYAKLSAYKIQSCRARSLNKLKEMLASDLAPEGASEDDIDQLADELKKVSGPGIGKICPKDEPKPGSCEWMDSTPAVCTSRPISRYCTIK